MYRLPCRAAALVQYPFATMTRGASKAGVPSAIPASKTVASDENRPFIFDKSDWRHYSERKEHAVVNERQQTLLVCLTHRF
jgi:hypothetical protein